MCAHRIIIKLLKYLKFLDYKQNINPGVSIISRYINKKLIDKIYIMKQSEFFKWICDYLNALIDDPYCTKIHNSFPKTSLKDYSKLSIWNQIFHNIYPQHLWYSQSCDWWGCSYWTILFYHVFDTLRSAWFDIKISFFRFKWVWEHVGIPNLRHSWLIINFQWIDYLVDYEWLNLNFFWTNNEKCVKSISELQECIRQYGEIFSRIDPKELEEISKYWKLKEYKQWEEKWFDNLKFWWNRNSVEDEVSFFDNIDDFVKNTSDVRWANKFVFYYEDETDKNLYHYTIIFEKWSLFVEKKLKDVVQQRIQFLLNQDMIIDNRKNILDILSCNIVYKLQDSQVLSCTMKDFDELKKILWLLSNKVDLNYLKEFYKNP